MGEPDRQTMHQPPTPAQLQRWICGMVPGWSAEDIGGFLFLEGGYSNRNYRFSHGRNLYVLRVPYRQRPFVDRQQEQALLLTAGLPETPEIVAFDADSGFMISRWVSGHLLADLTPAPEDLLTYLRRLHARLPGSARQYNPLDQARQYLRGANAPDWIHRMVEALDWPPAGTVSCHNDLNPWNVIREPSGRWITLDWEWFGRNDPLFDLVTLHQSLALDRDLLPALAEALLAERVPASRLHACLSAFWLREFAWAAAEIAAGDTRSEIAEQRALGEERLRALR